MKELYKRLALWHNQPKGYRAPQIWNQHNLSSLWSVALNFLKVLPQEMSFIYPDISKHIWPRNIISSEASISPRESTKLSNIKQAGRHLIKADKGKAFKAPWAPSMPLLSNARGGRKTNISKGPGSQESFWWWNFSKGGRKKSWCPEYRLTHTTEIPRWVRKKLGHSCPLP